MPIQTTETIAMGDVIICDNRTRVFELPQLASGLLVCLYDPGLPLLGLAHIVLPDSTIAADSSEAVAGKYADRAMPLLIQGFEDKSGSLERSVIKLVGGAQLFSFGGGGGNILNIGSRNAIAVRAFLSKYGLAVEKADVGGNKVRTVKIILATGQIMIQQIGAREYIL
ncbi:MAG: chemotaxis protein CheD [Vampirovibrionales bacterium]|nr:chemotaxis protein CheD [Vampirovibrionales bacterium]